MAPEDEMEGGNVRSRNECLRCQGPRGPGPGILCSDCRPPLVFVKPSRRRRDKELAQGVSRDQWEAILAAYNHKCAYCGQPFPRLQREHVIPVAKGGKHEPTNIVPACWSCNKAKGMGPAPSLPALRLMI